MTKKSSRHVFVALPFLLGLLFFVGLINVKAVTIFGVNNKNQLVRFDSATPSAITTVGIITGLQPSETILEIDFRPANGLLYGLGSTSRIYTINTTTGAATLVGSLTTPLSGMTFGFDFNPVVDRLRIVSDADQNLRVNPDNATAIVDGTLQFAQNDPNQGRDPNVAGSYYTNNVAGATTTELTRSDSSSSTRCCAISRASRPTLPGCSARSRVTRSTVQGLKERSRPLEPSSAKQTQRSRFCSAFSRNRGMGA
jgi:hypothetical protein